MRPYSALLLLLLAGCTPCGLADPVHHTWFVGGGSVTVALTAEEAGAVEGSFTVAGGTAEELAAEELGSGEGAWMRAEEQDVPAGEFGVGVLTVVGTFTPTSVDCGPSQLSLSLDVFEDSVGEPEHASKGQERATLYLAGDNDAGGVHASGGQHDGYLLEAPTWDEGRATIEGVRFAYVSGSDCLGVSELDAESAASTVTVAWALDPGVVAAEEYTCPG